jgi:ABC-2 type transport system permease protein
METAMHTAIVSTADLPVPATGAGHAQSWRIYLLETKYEFLKLLRLPHYLVGTLGFPVMFYLLFGVSLAKKSDGPIGAAEFLLASYSVFGVVTAALFALGAGVAVERAQGWMTLKRATPMPVSAYLGAKIFSSMCFGTVILALMGLCGVTLGGVRFAPAVWLNLWAVMVLGCIPFCLGGLIIAFTVPPTGAPGIVNLINLPLSFAGGLWFPVSMMPAFLQAIAPWLPQYHLGQLALGAIGAVDETRTLEHVLALGGYAAIFAALAWRAYRRSDVAQ